MREFALLFGMFLVTFGVRYLPLALVERVGMPPSVARALRYVPVAVLTAITVPIMLFRGDALSFGVSNAYLYAGVAAGVVSWRSKNLLLTIVLGLAIFFVWRWVFATFV
ncbi:MAG: AzlD domain-containing protein [Phototrophicaceae bacterium]|jgi:branched-subunit amino acid transport protein